MAQFSKIIQGDTFELLNSIEDSSVDLIICDGPYGVTSYDWDKIASIQEFNLNLIEKYSKKLKDGGALYLFGKSNCIDFIDYRPFLKLNFCITEKENPLNIIEIYECEPKEMVKEANRQLDRSKNNISHVGYRKKWLKRNTKLVYPSE